jgi:hypothetical protein
MKKIYKLQLLLFLDSVARGITQKTRRVLSQTRINEKKFVIEFKIISSLNF